VVALLFRSGKRSRYKLSIQLLSERDAKRTGKDARDDQRYSSEA